MKNNVRLDIRIPSDLKAMFTALCENQGISVSAKIKNLISEEMRKNINSDVSTKNTPKTQSKPLISHSETVVNTTLPETVETKIETPREELRSLINPLLSLVDKDTEVNISTPVNSIVQSAINSANKRKPKKKKR